MAPRVRKHSQDAAKGGPVEMIGVHRRLLAKRIQLWQGRISDHAVERALIAYEMTFFAFLAAITCLILAGISSLAEISAPATAALVVLAFVVPGVLLAIGLRGALAAGRDVAQSYGLPQSAGRKARLKTPAQFDRWLAAQSVPGR